MISRKLLLQRLQRLRDRFNKGWLFLLLPTLLFANANEARLPDRSNNEIPSDIALSQLKGAIQSSEMKQFIIPIEELESARALEKNEYQDNHHSFLSLITNSVFHPNGFSEKMTMTGYHNQEARWAIHEIYKPYENDQRELYVMSLFGDEVYDEKYLLEAVLRRDYSISTHQWNQNILTKKINLTTARDLIREGEENEYISIVIEMDDQFRPQRVSQLRLEEKEGSETFRYLSFTEYQALDVDRLPQDVVIYVIATPEDIAGYRSVDFQNLHSQILISVKEDFDEAGNPQIEREYNSKAAYIKQNSFIYY